MQPSSSTTGTTTTTLPSGTTSSINPSPAGTPAINVLSTVSGINFSLMDVISGISLIAPFLLAFLMIMISIINTNVKGLIYMLGLVILFILVILFQNTFKQPPSPDGFCNLFSVTHYGTPSFNSALYLYTITYVLLPMINMGMMNYPLIIVFLGLYASDCIVKYYNKCSSRVGIIMGSILGLFVGFVWFVVIRASGQTGLLYYDDLISSKIACSRPTKQQFKCRVYKNGELIENI
jgi:hypothetical protein